MHQAMTAAKALRKKNRKRGGQHPKKDFRRLQGLRPCSPKEKNCEVEELLTTESLHEMEKSVIKKNRYCLVEWARKMFSIGSRGCCRKKGRRKKFCCEIAKRESL